MTPKRPPCLLPAPRIESEPLSIFAVPLMDEKGLQARERLYIEAPDEREAINFAIVLQPDANHGWPQKLDRGVAEQLGIQPLRIV